LRRNVETRKWACTHVVLVNAGLRYGAARRSSCRDHDQDIASPPESNSREGGCGVTHGRRDGVRRGAAARAVLVGAFGAGFHGAIAVGVYGCGVAAALLELAYTRSVAKATGEPLTKVVETASYTVDPVIEELVKVAPLLLVAWMLWAVPLPGRGHGCRSATCVACEAGRVGRPAARGARREIWPECARGLRRPVCSLVHADRLAFRPTAAVAALWGEGRGHRMPACRTAAAAALAPEAEGPAC
jgi:hypothetical protein